MYETTKEYLVCKSGKALNFVIRRYTFKTFRVASIVAFLAFSSDAAFIKFNQQVAILAIYISTEKFLDNF
jgi:hypothetical protein